VLLSGDKMLLERRAASWPPRARCRCARSGPRLRVFGTPGADPGTVAVAAVRAALKL
jgi:hypothetical protein